MNTDFVGGKEKWRTHASHGGKCAAIQAGIARTDLRMAAPSRNARARKQIFAMRAGLAKPRQACAANNHAYG
jgi:hypothetical protein